MADNRPALRGLGLAAAVSLLAVPMLAQEAAVPDEATKVHPLLIGSRVPDATYQRSDGSMAKLRDEVGKKPTVLIYYRGGW